MKRTRASLADSVAIFSGATVMISSFQTQRLLLPLHLVNEVLPPLDVIFVDTGYHFPEALTFRDQVGAEVGLRLRVLRADGWGGGDVDEPPYRTNPVLCCHVREVQALRLARKDCCL